MQMTGKAIRNNVVPVWNEVKDWSREDRANLYELLEVSLSERMTDSGMQSFVDSLDVDALHAAAEFAYHENKAGRCIPQSQVFDLLKEEMGWR